MADLSQRLGGVALGLVLDRLVPEPSTPWHPVAWFGRAMGAVERRLWTADVDRQRVRGLAYATAGVAVGAGFGRVVGMTAPVVTLVVAGNELRRIGRRIGAAAMRDLDEARAELPSLVGRDPSTLDESGIAAAVIESLAENQVDAVVAPVFWAVLAGAPGAAAYRAINTMDAMVGHRNERYGRFGMGAAGLDDAANWVPARAFALLVLAVEPSRRGEILRAIRGDAPAHPSPNAGVAEAAVAAALGVEVGGPLRYGDRVEDRPPLGTGPRPTPADVDRATALTSRTEWLLATLLAVGSVLKRCMQRSRTDPT